MNQLKLGVGYHPAFSFGDGATIALPRAAELMELGLAELKDWRASPKLRKEMGLSLHLSRSPITEDERSQDMFIEHLRASIGDARLVSVGLHVTGERGEGIGRFGFSSHFAASAEKERRAARFASAVAERLGAPVWLENANFYSGSQEEVLACWDSLRRICAASDAKVILDLSHMAIDAHNVGLELSACLGAVPWPLVAEVHLSGIVEGGGAWHDGHSLPVHSATWALLESCLTLLASRPNDIFLTLEHTDVSWRDCVAEFEADCSRLTALAASTRRAFGADRGEEADGYAKGYLKRLLKRQIPKLEAACVERGISFDTLFQEWLLQRVETEGLRLSLTADELAPSDAAASRVAAPDFLAYTKGRLV
jgi:hypothetical protein